MNGNGNGNGSGRWRWLDALALLVSAAVRALVPRRSKDAQSQPTGEKRNMIFTMAFFAAVWALLKIHQQDDVDGTLDLGEVLIFTNNIVPDKDTVFGDLTEATWTGYSRSSAVTWGTPVISGETDLYCMVGDLKTFTCSANVDEEVAYGYAIVNGDDDLLAARRFDEPIQITAGHAIGILPRVGLSPAANVPSGDVAVV